MFASVCGCTKHDAYHYVFKIFSIYFVCTNKLFLKSRGRKSVYILIYFLRVDKKFSYIFNNYHISHFYNHTVYTNIHYVYNK